MNRLTQRNKGGNAYFPHCFEQCNGIPEDCGNCDFNTKVCEALAAFEDTGLTPEMIVEMMIDRNPSHLINICNSSFAEAEEQLNKELSEAIGLLKKSPMFEGRVTMAIVISDKGEGVRPILYPTKYTPKKQNPEEHDRNLPGQLTFDE